MQRREWYMIDYGVDVGSTAELAHYTYEAAKAKAGKYAVRKVVVDETWTEPEEEWVTPTDEDARHRPKVEVRYSFENEWKPAILLMVTFIEGKPIYVAHTKHSDNMHWNHCRIYKHEVELIYGLRKDRR
jgi:hypothetical protein